MKIGVNDIEIITREILNVLKSKSLNNLGNEDIIDKKRLKYKENITQNEISDTIINIFDEIKSSLLEIDNLIIKDLVNLIKLHERVFIAGIGRSGLIARTFGMRLMQIGFTVFIVGETTTPAIQSNDLLISISGSGRTSNSINILKKAKDFGAYTFLITANGDSPMVKIADSFIFIPAPTKFQNNKNDTSSQLIGSLFEQSTFILFECIVDILSRSLDLKHDEIMKRHANLE